MTSLAPIYHGYRFPPDIISYAVWLYHRFSLSFRDAEDLLAHPVPRPQASWSPDFAVEPAVTPEEKETPM